MSAKSTRPIFVGLFYAGFTSASLVFLMSVASIFRAACIDWGWVTYPPDLSFFGRVSTSVYPGALIMASLVLLVLMALETTFLKQKRIPFDAPTRLYWFYALGFLCVAYGAFEIAGLVNDYFYHDPLLLSRTIRVGVILFVLAHGIALVRLETGSPDRLMSLAKVRGWVVMVVMLLGLLLTFSILTPQKIAHKHKMDALLLGKAMRNYLSTNEDDASQ
ncbi:hypothetical protein [Candidatus Hepatobacter penaei]|uniref:hypothetical protein n=1 Tax=Candidatus Hepatobacter penaei TaxID=1274402 RepID=UPI0010937EEB|nr:hypothetical protein [Candidatus Hepatobacter penaei]TGW14814.1 hypothetical protein EIL50_04155 [bacterium NHP-B]